MEVSVFEAPKPAVGILPRRRRAKGEKSRQTILEATLTAISKYGLHNITHRVIATEAEVPLSLTTYFFKSLADLIDQAFDHFTAQAESDHCRVITELAKVIDSLDPASLGDAQTRELVKARFTDILTEFLTAITIEHPTGIAVELNFLYLYRLDPALRTKAEAYRQRLIQGVATLLRPLSADPAHLEIDAELVLSIVHRLEFDCINHANSISRERLRARVGRQISHIIDMTRPA